MNEDLAQKAVTAALAGDWKEAEKINKQILKDDKSDVDALNRLARACAEQGNLKKAKETAQKVLKINPFNQIASKSLKKWKSLRRGETTASGPSSAEAFLEEPGKTKMVSLLHLGASSVLAKLDAGDEVKLTPHKHRVSVTTLDGKYIGRLPDDIAAILRKLTKHGNEYQTLIKSIEPKDVRVFIRETKRSEKLKDTPSFPAEKINYISF
jgi:tetratricopeptide (TPR) repeat protein